MTIVLCFAAGCAAVFFAAKYFSVRKSMRGVCRDFAELIGEDTNTLISVNSGDRAVRELASELNRQLRELRRLERKFTDGDHELKEAVTNISHDLRTPLTAIYGYLELLHREEKSEQVGRYISRIENRAEAMRRLTEELFRYSVIISASEGEEPLPTDIGAVLEESIAGLYGAFVERGISPEITMPDEKIVRCLDREALSRVFGNILGNALKYSDGDLVVKMSPDGSVEFSNTAENLNGVDVGKLFDRFFSVEAARNSTGLGLAIAKELTERMGGKISAEMNGSILTIRIEWSDFGEES